MLSEVANALLLTYLATEHHLQQQDYHRRSDWPILTPRNLILVVLVGIINVIDHLSGQVVNQWLLRFSQFPRIALAAVGYVIALYGDCRRSYPLLTLRRFGRLLGAAVLYVLPVYPFWLFSFRLGSCLY